MRLFRFHAVVAVLALTLALVLAPLTAQARLGGGSSFGSRGYRTYSAPAPTPGARFGAAPIGRSMTSPSYGSSRPYGGYGYASGGSMFGRGFLGGLLGAGLFGLLFGHGFFGGMGGGGSLLGLLIQLALLYFVVKWAFRLFSGAQPGFASSMFSGAGQGGAPGSTFGAGPSIFSGFGGAQSASGQPIQLQGEDYNAFEYLLQESQTAFGAEDLDRLRTVSTPEMASYFAEQIAQDARRGVINKIADVRLLKGDLSEAWRDAMGEFATVSLRFSLLDWTVDRTTGQVVEGDPRSPQEAMEFWTFRRDPGAGPRGWRISAIQQASA